MYINGRTEEALETLRTALVGTPPEERYLLGETHYHLGLIYHQEGEIKFAEKHFRKSLENYPSPKREREIKEIQKDQTFNGK